ncbi:hypothetical protein DFH08DRAFT_799691 [Mycena albidolilacea]|uniref:Uncharacterized protein n=1 Tax=Mycena albidolilacea TaxID=1033008 RepID=A0AAD7F2P4_9AGAR|nr:hypothetical protein DFH08DRAFT_799691 [Mycena albidolilacea]
MCGSGDDVERAITRAGAARTQRCCDGRATRRKEEERNRRPHPNGRFSPLPADALQLGHGAGGHDPLEIERYEGGSVGDGAVLREDSEAQAGVDAAGMRQAFGAANGAPNTKVTARECFAGVEYGEGSATTGKSGKIECRRKGRGQEGRYNEAQQQHEAKRTKLDPASPPASPRNHGVVRTPSTGKCADKFLRPWEWGRVLVAQSELSMCSKARLAGKCRPSKICGAETRRRYGELIDRMACAGDEQWKTSLKRARGKAEGAYYQGCAGLRS